MSKMGYAIFGVIVLLIVGAVTYPYWNARTNYVPARARVIELTCTAELNYISGRTHVRGEPQMMACEAAGSLSTDTYDVYQTVSYTYTSPVDSREYRGVFRADPSDYLGVRVGAEIEILAHSREPQKSARVLPGLRR